jgi:hypothetical protein
MPAAAAAGVNAKARIVAGGIGYGIELIGVGAAIRIG